MNSLKTKPVFILSGARTPIGSFKGSLGSISATKLGITAVKGALKKAGISCELVDQVYMGNVISANSGQAPARQVALGSGCQVPSSTINKVCASGMKAVMLASESLTLGNTNIMIAGGMESMSNVPFYIERNSLSYGHQNVFDGIIKDGLWDVYNQVHMGTCAENTAKKHNLTREQQDAYAIQSYTRSANAWKNGLFQDEIVPVEIATKKGTILVDHDEEYKKVNFEKIPSLKPVFDKKGTITAANAR